MTPYYVDELVELYCGDCRKVMAHLPDDSVDLIVTSPPYNVRMPYPHGDEIPWPDYYAMMHEVLGHCYRLLRAGGTICLNVPGVVRWQADHKHADTWSDFDPLYQTHRNGVREAGRGRIEPVGFKLFDMMFAIDRHLREPIIWVKGARDGDEAMAANSKTGSDNNPYFRQTHEMILIGSKAQWFHRGGTGRRGRDAVPSMDYLKDCWILPGSHDSCHPAPFPKEIPHRLIKLFCHAPDSLVLDPFCGVGTTLLAAKESGYRSIGIEVAEQYCAVARERCSQKLLALAWNQRKTGAQKPLDLRANNLAKEETRVDD